MDEETESILEQGNNTLALYQERKRRQEGENLLIALPQGEGSGLNADLLDGKHKDEIIHEAREGFVIKASGSGGGVGIVDHGLLQGLGDDDHPQYVKDAGDTMTGDLLFDAALTRSIASGSAALLNIYSRYVNLQVPSIGAKVAYLYGRTSAGVLKALVTFNETTTAIIFGAGGYSVGMVGATFTLTAGTQLNLRSSLVTMFDDAIENRYFRFGQVTTGGQDLASSTTLGRMIFIDDGEASGNPSQLLICYRDAADVYHWRDLISGADV